MKMITSKKGIIVLIIAASFLLGAFTSKALFKAITADDVRKAGNIMGLEFTQQEIDSLLPGLEEFRNDYISNREKQIPNSIGPGLEFNPLPSGFDLNTTQLGMGFSNIRDVKMPVNKDSLAFLSVRYLAELIRSKQTTSVELTKFFLERLKKYDPKLKCVITLTEELALEQAKKADAEIAKGNYKGLLHGIPYGAKDLLATKKYKTTWGATPYKDQSFDYDATVIQKLEEAGAVLVAKLTLGALAWGDVWYGGKTRNPWDPESGSSGSSAGPASAVSAGLVPFAIGTETLGSIVSPSTVCGTTGLRPTFGRVSRFGAMALSWSMDKIGPICRSAEDCAIVFNSIYGPDGKDRSVIDAPFNYNARRTGNQSLKIGYLKKDFEKDYAFKQQDSLTLVYLKNMRYELIPIELPEFPEIGFILDVEAAAAFDELSRSGKDDQLVRQLRRAWPNVFRQARFVPAVEYIQANRLRTQLKDEMQKIFEKVDIYVNPSWASSSLRITNFTGHPCVVIPNGFKDGKPTSITITGKLFEEAKILGLAKALQDYAPFLSKNPSLD